jgi:hypothetical protein
VPCTSTTQPPFLCIKTQRTVLFEEWADPAFSQDRSQAMTPVTINLSALCTQVTEQAVLLSEVSDECTNVCALSAGLRPELLNERLISLSNDTLAVVDMAEKGKGTLTLLIKAQLARL